MTLPRLAIPGATYLVTRSTTMSMHLLVPSAEVNQIMEYCIAWAARGRGIIVHAVSIESNHFHIVLTDTKGRLSDFMQELNRCSARCLLQYYRSRFGSRRLETLWTNAQPFSAVLLVNANAILDKIVYTLTNPVKDGLVRDYRKWPGFNTRPSDWRRGERSVARPAYYFKHTPETLTYEVSAPCQLGSAVEQVIATVELHIRNAQDQHAANLTSEGRTFAGQKAVLNMDPMQSPATLRPRKTVNPHVAAGRDAAALATAKRALRLFRQAYRLAWKAFRSGADAVFPGGTLLMQTRFKRRCEALDACWCELAT